MSRDVRTTQSKAGLPPVAAPLPAGEWMSKASPNANARAHFVLEDGRTACQAEKGLMEKWPQLALLVGPWRERDPWHHLCGLCARIANNTICVCGRCRSSRGARRAAQERR